MSAPDDPFNAAFLDVLARLDEALPELKNSVHIIPKYEDGGPWRFFATLDIAARPYALRLIPLEDVSHAKKKDEDV